MAGTKRRPKVRETDSCFGISSPLPLCFFHQPSSAAEANCTCTHARGMIRAWQRRVAATRQAAKAAHSLDVHTLSHRVRRRHGVGYGWTLKFHPPSWPPSACTPSPGCCQSSQWVSGRMLAPLCGSPAAFIPFACRYLMTLFCCCCPLPPGWFLLYFVLLKRIPVIREMLGLNEAASATPTPTPSPMTE